MAANNANNAAAAPPTYDVKDAMIKCGISNTNNYAGTSPAERIATQIFDDDFQSCMDLQMDELNRALKILATLPRNQGQVIIMPLAKRKMKAFIQWTRDQIRNGRDPKRFEFPVADTTKLLDRMETHDRFRLDAEHAPKPQMFTKDMKWEDWSTTFVEYLGCLSGRSGDPLKYVKMAKLSGNAYVQDNRKVLTLINQFIVGNDVAEGAVRPLNTQSDGRAAFQALERKYMGDGILQNKVSKAEQTIDSLYYTGENSYMPWEKFEAELIGAYAVMDKHYKRQAYADETKLRKLQKDRIRADFLKLNHASIQARCSDIPMTMTFTTAIAIYRW